MPRSNRVDPWGDLHAVAARGAFTGNRGCLVDGSGIVTRHHSGNLWITCLASFRNWSHPLDAPRTWTPLFFLDDAVALAAGHRPCATCRPDAYRSYRDALTRGLGRDAPLRATEINSLLAGERLMPGSGVSRAADRITWNAPIDDLPDGTVMIDEQRLPRLVIGRSTLAFSFEGWTTPPDHPAAGSVTVLTPPASVAALRHGFVPVLHDSATRSAPTR